MSSLFPKEFTLKNGKKVNIRQAEPNDAEALLKFSEQIFEDDEFFLTTREDILDELTVEKQKERVEKHLNKSGKVLLVAEVDGVIAGTSEVNNVGRKRRQHVGRVGINALKEYRGLGVGTALMKSVVFWAQDDAVIEKLVLEVFIDNETALGLYRKIGFIEEGRSIKAAKFSPSKYKDCILMFKFVK